MKEEVKDILEIDKFSLDKEWERQSILYMEWAEKVAEKQLHRDKMKFNLEYVKANLDYQIRSSPEKYGIVRVTEASIQNAIINQPEYIAAKDKFIKAEYDLSLAQSIKEALHHKKKALENLTQLWLSGYYSEPTIPEPTRDKVEGARRRDILKKLKETM